MKNTRKYYIWILFLSILLVLGVVTLIYGIVTQYGMAPLQFSKSLPL